MSWRESCREARRDVGCRVAIGKSAGRQEGDGGRRGDSGSRGVEGENKAKSGFIRCSRQLVAGGHRRAGRARRQRQESKDLPTMF